MLTLKDWAKCPSVTSGGKQYFYTRKDRYGCRWWIVGVKGEKQWLVHNDRSKDEAWFDTVAEAIDWFNALPE